MAALAVLAACVPATHVQAGGVPPPRPLTAEYRFGWESVPAARATIRLARATGNRFQLRAEASTSGLARKLWQMDATYRSELDRGSLLPSRVEQIENYDDKRVTTRLAFTRDHVTRDRQVAVKGRTDGKPRRFRTPLARDLAGALLWVRAQPLAAGDRYSLTVFPSASPYLAEAVVAGREKLKIGGRTTDTIRVELGLKALNPDGTTSAVKKFRRARAWLSDDADRIVVRAEADVFIGSVVAELSKVEFD